MKKPVRVRRCVRLGTKREFPTKRLAERRMEQILARINGWDYQPGRASTFGEFVEAWKAEVLTEQQPSSPRAARSHLRCYIVPQLGKLRLELVSVENQQTFLMGVLGKGVSRKTALNVFGTVGSILRTSRNWGYKCEELNMKAVPAPARGAVRGTPFHYRSIEESSRNRRRTMANALLHFDPWRPPRVRGPGLAVARRRARPRAFTHPSVCMVRENPNNENGSQ